MNANRAALFVCLVCLAGNNSWADQVVLKNGDRITGALVKKDDKNLTIKADLFGLVTVPWDKVDSVTADQPVNVVLNNGKEVQGKLATEAGVVQVIEPQERISAPLAEVRTIRDAKEQAAYQRLLRPGWMQLWAGVASLGFAGTTGNAKTSTFTTGVTAARVTRKDKTALYFNTIKASALLNGKTAETAEAIRGSTLR